MGVHKVKAIENWSAYRENLDLFNKLSARNVAKMLIFGALVPMGIYYATRQEQVCRNVLLILSRVCSANLRLWNLQEKQSNQKGYINHRFL